MDKVLNNLHPVSKSLKMLTNSNELNDAIYNQVELSNFDLIVFCHLRWEFVFQRPQHLISRLAENRKVLFVEEPIPFAAGEEGTVRMYHPTENITVIQPKLQWEKYLDEVIPIVNEYASALDLNNPIVWLYSANFYPVLEQLDHSLVVYDCMDELSAFQGASKSLLSFEKKLIEEADVVFTGGKSLYESKRKITDTVHCFPSSVDRVHFEKALLPATKVPADIKNIPGPVIGFYGVIDERLDLQLLKDVAEKLPEVSFVIIGPVVKIDPTSLPQLSNIHYLGQKSYQELPNYLKAIDVAMMPFALNEATKFISPTKTLEFMAALKPIVSTPIYDVKRDYSHVVKIAKNANEFVAVVKKYISESATEKQQRIAKQEQIIERTSWDLTTEKMSLLMMESLQQKRSKQQRRVEANILNQPAVQVSL